MRNNNQTVIRKIALSSLKSSKMRNLFIILTVILSVSLLSGLALFVTGVEESEKRLLNTMQHVIYQRVNAEQIASLEDDPRIDSFLLFKRGKGFEVDNYILTPMYYEQKNTPMRSVVIEEGTYPTGLFDIAVDKAYMSRIGKPAVIGEKLPFTFLDGTTEEFTITGFTDTGDNSNTFLLILSELYAESGSQLKEHSYHAPTRIVDAEYMSESEFLETIRTIGTEYGIERQNVNENNAFVVSIGNSSEQMIFVLLVGFGVLLASILVIYSVFYISVINRTREFGQLRTLGATKKQIKRIVNREGIILCFIGSPFGLLIGSIFAYFIKPDGFNIITTVLVWCLVFLINLLTVLISIRKPASMAASISPIEATKMVDADANIKRNTRKRQSGKLTMWTLAKLNIARNRKKTVLTVCSLGIGGILFLCGATMIKSMNKEEYSRQGQFRFGEYLLYISNNAAELNENGMTGVQAQGNPINDELMESIRKINGVKDLSVNKKLSIEYEYNGIRSKDHLVSFAKEDVAALQGGLEDGRIDYDLMVKNREVLIVNNSVAEEIFGWRFETGDEVLIQWFDGEQQRDENFTVAGSLNITDENYSVTVPAGWFVVPDVVLEDMLVEGFNLNSELTVSVENYELNGAQIETQIRDIADQNPLLKLYTLREAMLKDKNTFRVLNSMVFGISFFIIAFSLINLINTLITNVMSRKKEFAGLQSVGMEGRQLSRMIQYEGAMLAIWNLVVTVLFGTVAGYGLIEFMRNLGADYMHFRFPTWYLLAYSAVIVTIPIVISSASIKVLCRKSLVERLREVE